MTARDLHDFLQTFVEQHRGLRFGKMFGRPAGYAGRRMFAHGTKEGLAIRVSGAWVVHRPKNAADTRKLLPLLEVAAREVAERQNSRSVRL